MSAANVVKFTGRRARPLVHLVDSPVALDLVRQELLASKLFYTAIAQRAQVSSSTVSNIASGQTKYPRLETIIRILGGLGWRILAERDEKEDSVE